MHPAYEVLDLLPTMKCNLSECFCPSAQDEYDMEIYEDNTGWRTCERYTIHSTNLSLHTFIQFLRYVLHGQYKYDNKPPSWSHSVDLIYYICILAWNNADSRNKQNFATIEAEHNDYEGDDMLYLIVDFPEIYNYIVEKSLVIYHGFASINFPDNLRWSDKEKYTIFKHFDGNATVLSIRDVK